MEYSILKSIENPISYQTPLLNRLRSPYPNRDYVNPGIGQSARIFDIFVPIFQQKPPHCSNKAIDQQGFGDSSESIKAESSSDLLTKNNNKTDPDAKTFDQRNRNDSIDVDEADEIDVKKANERKRKLLGSEIFDAFMHPVIKTAKLSLKSPKKEKSEEPDFTEKNKPAKANLSLSSVEKKVPMKSEKHKFKII